MKSILLNIVIVLYGGMIYSQGIDDSVSKIQVTTLISTGNTTMQIIGSKSVLNNTEAEILGLFHLSESYNLSIGVNHNLSNGFFDNSYEEFSFIGIPIMLSLDSFFDDGNLGLTASAGLVNSYLYDSTKLSETMNDDSTGYTLSSIAQIGGLFKVNEKLHFSLGLRIKLELYSSINDFNEFNQESIAPYFQVRFSFQSLYFYS